MKKKCIIVLISVLSVLIFFFWQIYFFIKLENANHLLISGIKENNTKVALHALEEGANADAVDLGTNPTSLIDQIKLMFKEIMHDREYPYKEIHPTALSVLMDRRQEKNLLTTPPENVTILKALINKKANVNFRNMSGTTPLMLAALYDHEESVKILIENGADVNIKSKSGWNALIFAGGNMNILKMILDKNPNLNVIDNFGETVLDAGKDFFSEEAKKLLIKYGAKSTKEVLDRH